MTFFDNVIDDDTQTDCSSEYSRPISVASVVTEAVEVRELQWVKKYRVPKFPSANEDRHRSLIPAIINSTEVAAGSTSEVQELDFDKPLPALPVSTPSQSSFSSGKASSRALRRSRSTHLDML